jgi:hypothetical protein
MTTEYPSLLSQALRFWRGAGPALPHLGGKCYVNAGGRDVIALSK